MTSIIFLPYIVYVAKTSVDYDMAYDHEWA